MKVGCRCAAQHIAQRPLGPVCLHDVAVGSNSLRNAKIVQPLRRRFRSDAEFLGGRWIVASGKGHRKHFGRRVRQPQQVECSIVRENPFCIAMLCHDILVLPSVGRAVEASLEFHQLAAAQRLSKLAILNPAGLGIRSGHVAFVTQRYFQKPAHAWSK